MSVIDQSASGFEPETDRLGSFIVRTETVGGQLEFHAEFDVIRIGFDAEIIIETNETRNKRKERRQESLNLRGVANWEGSLPDG